MRFALSLAAASALLLSGLQAQAAEIRELSFEDGNGIVAVSGTFELGDEAKFEKAVARYRKGFVLFQSDGGALPAGLRIGEIIREREFDTGVGPDMACASACALAWLGGTRRFIARTGKIGFHAAYIVKDGAPQEAGLPNAVVGAYLTRLGFPLSAVMHVTREGPSGITWLTEEDAREVGITYALLDPETAAAPAPTIRSKPAESPVTRQASPPTKRSFGQAASGGDTGGDPASFTARDVIQDMRKLTRTRPDGAEEPRKARP